MGKHSCKPCAPCASLPVQTFKPDSRFYLRGLQVVRGMVASRQGMQGKVRETSVFSELVKLLPADLFRACLAQVSSCFRSCSS